MLSLLIFIFLVFGFFIGLKRGFILQAIHFVSFFIAFIIAAIYYDDLAETLTIWIPYPSFGDEVVNIVLDTINAESAYYNAVAFVIIFFTVKILLQVIGSMLDFLANIPVLKQLNVWAGSILGFLEVYLIIFILLYIGATLPLDFIQSAIENSFMADFIINHTPILTKQIQDLWLTYTG